ncbi:MAG TPA: hypothetical protein ENL06_01370 [Candidatus Portnoybacteria bacterium]|nr:hypothetical protein [Candidatus Portnoybacteria bacterium]
MFFLLRAVEKIKDKKGGRKMKSVKKREIFKPNVELLILEGELGKNEWQKVVENPRLFIKDDCGFESMDNKPMDNIKRRKKKR